MSNYLIQSQTLTDIADAIRSKTGSSSPISGANMASEISAISTGPDGLIAFNIPQDVDLIIERSIQS